MTVWLQRQEAVVRRDSYVEWVCQRPCLADEDEDASSPELSDEEGSEGEGESGLVVGHAGINTDYQTLKQLLTSNVRRAYQLPCAPTTLRVRIHDLHSCYGARDFLADLTVFLGITTLMPSIRTSLMSSTSITTYSCCSPLTTMSPTPSVSASYVRHPPCPVKVVCQLKWSTSSVLCFL